MEIVKRYPATISSLDGNTDAIIIALSASREVDGARVPITAAQKDAAMEAAKAVLQCVGAEVGAFSSALLVPGTETAENETLGLTIDVAVTKNANEDPQENPVEN